MKRLVEKLIARLWNRIAARRQQLPRTSGLLLGNRVVDETVTSAKVTIPHSRRATHIALLGRTGTGKSSLIRWFCEQDVKADRGFILFDLHGELSGPVLALIAAKERQANADLSERLIVMDPADAAYAVGLNPLQGNQEQNAFLRVSQFAEVLKQRWGLHAFGARTDELLRNSLLVLAENDLTLLELSLLLTDASFRARCLSSISNAEVIEYFETRYGKASEGMQAVMREPILSRASLLVGDPHFRFILGQRSTFSLPQALDCGSWVLVNLAKGKLGPEALTLGALLLTLIKHAAFARESRELVSVYADEVQNLIGYGADLETMLAEARKFGIGICTANQYLEQLPQELRAALLAIGTLGCFQLSPPDAQFAATALDGGKPLAEHLKNLPRRHLIVKSGSEPLTEVAVPDIREPHADWHDLYARSLARWARPRAAIEAEIAMRHASASNPKEEDLNGWE